MEANNTKALARSAARKIRALAHEEQKLAAPLALLAHAFPVVEQAGRSVVSGFFPYQSEIDVRPLLGKLAGDGWTTCLPIVIADNQPLEFRRWLPGEPTVAGVWGIPRPPEDMPVVVPDVLLVPLLAFDRSGYRLGYGGGYYDRTLALLRGAKTVVAIGVAYSAQEVDAVPHDGRDQMLDFVMTEKEVIRCG